MQITANFEITQSLRTALKSRGITYKDLADRINVSEQTIKRLFKDKDCSLSRLNEICDAINISVYDLLEYSKHLTEPLAELTPQQELFLRDHPSHFCILFFLTTQHSIDEIQSTYHLTNASVFRYLRELEKQGFIDLFEENRFRMRIEGKLLMRLRGPLHEMVRRLNHIFLDYCVDQDGSNGVSFNSSFRFMTENTLNELRHELDALHKKYRKIAHQNEMILPREKLQPVKWSTLVAPFAICGQWPVEKEPKKG